MKAGADEIRIRRMNVYDIERVFMIAWSRKHAPKWTKMAYLYAVNGDAAPRRIALVAEDSGEGHTTLLVDWQAPDFAGPPNSATVGEEAKTCRVVGFAIASLVPPQAELETIVIAAAEQRRGIGRKLMAAMADELSAAAVSEALLEVRASNDRAIGFYQSMGWRETGRRPRYYAEPEEDAVLMSLALG